MDKRIGKELQRLEQVLQEQSEIAPLERMRREVAQVRRVLDELRVSVLENGFEGVAEEVYFFKEVKPRFHALMIFSVERFHFESNRPALGGKELERYCRGQLEFIGRFFAQHGLMYQYYRLGASDLDEKFFVRENVADDMSFVGLPEIYPVFSTYGEYLFSKFMALEKLRELVLGELLVPLEGGREAVRSKKGRELRWTGDSCNLIELAYGLFDCRQINHGEVDLSDVMEVFEQVFQINLSRYFRRFTEIKRRKSMSKTRFLDQMKAAVEKRIEDGDAYVPMSMR